jgi:hypothetical protein
MSDTPVNYDARLNLWERRCVSNMPFHEFVQLAMDAAINESALSKIAVGLKHGVQTIQDRLFVEAKVPVKEPEHIEVTGLVDFEDLDESHMTVTLHMPPLPGETLAGNVIFHVELDTFGRVLGLAFWDTWTQRAIG